ncbi:organic hydroperoxide resistance protein, partial [Micrococcus sp. SIMBA_131]
MDPLYTTEAIATGGGRNAHVRTADGRGDMDPATPAEMGGSGDGAHPEQLV